MRLQHECSCAACDFDNKMQVLIGRVSKHADVAFHPEDINLSGLAFAYNMDEYTNVYVEVGLEWCQSYH